MLGSLYHHATLLALILIVMFSAHIFYECYPEEYEEDGFCDLEL